MKLYDIIACSKTIIGPIFDNFAQNIKIYVYYIIDLLCKKYVSAFLYPPSIL